MNRIFLYVISFFVFNLLAITASAQRTFKTKSGNEIVVLENSTWEFKSTTSSDSNEINPFELPEQISSNVSGNQLILINEILNNLKNLEAQSFVDLLFLSDQQSQQELKISYFESQKNKEGAKLEKELLDKIKDKKSELEDKYKNYSGKIEEVSNWKKENNTSLDEDIQKIIVELGINEAKIVNSENIIKVHSNEEIVIDSRLSYDIDNECNVKYKGPNPNGKGEFIQYHIEPFFNYTPAKIKPFYKEKDFLKASASVEKIDGDYFLLLELDFASKDVSKSYGIVKQGEQLQITLLGGYKIKLNSILNASPRLVVNAGNTLYNCVFEMDKSSRKILQKEYVDKIGVMYSTGFEEYTIYKVDLIMNQINCIENAD